MKKDESIKVVLIFSVFIALAAIFVCYSLLNMKEAEISNLKNRYESEISDLDIHIEDLNSDIEELKERKKETHKYIKQMVKGLEEYYEAGINFGSGDTYYDEAGIFYQDNDYYWCSLYAGYADSYYGHSVGSYRDAKAFFNTAMEYSISNDTKELAQKFVNLSELDAKLSNEMHEANEYFSSACDYFYDGNYEIGNGEIDEMNKHIEAHDNLVPKQNDMLAEINALLENM